MNIVTPALLRLPAHITFDGAHFALRIIPCGRELKLAYGLDGVDLSSPRYDLWCESAGWENPFSGGDLQGFLFLREGIEHDSDLISAAQAAETFLRENGLWQN